MAKCLRLTDKYNQVIDLKGMRPFLGLVKSVRVMNGKMRGRVNIDGLNKTVQYIANGCWGEVA